MFMYIHVCIMLYLKFYICMVAVYSIMYVHSYNFMTTMYNYALITISSDDLYTRIDR